MTPNGRKIAITGASGQLGKPTIASLVALGVHTITVIQRPNATSTFPAGVVVKNGNLEDENFLAEVLKGQNVLILMPPLSHLVQLQEPAIRAAAKVGVPYVFPSEFGPDPFAGKLTDENGLLVDKMRVRDLIENLGVSSWVSVVVGPWLDAGLSAGLWGIDAQSHKATIWQGAEGKVDMATIAHTGEALANNAVYASSGSLTQKELLNAVQHATSTTDVEWDIQLRDVTKVLEEAEVKIRQGDGVAPFVKFFVTHFLQGHGGDFQDKVDAAELRKLRSLGLHKEDLEQTIKTALQ